jgi:hypothetical protein
MVSTRPRPEPRFLARGSYVRRFTVPGPSLLVNSLFRVGIAVAMLSAGEGP